MLLVAKRRSAIPVSADQQPPRNARSCRRERDFARLLVGGISCLPGQLHWPPRRHCGGGLP